MTMQAAVNVLSIAGWVIVALGVGFIWLAGDRGEYILARSFAMLVLVAFAAMVTYGAVR